MKMTNKPSTNDAKLEDSPLSQTEIHKFSNNIQAIFNNQQSQERHTQDNSTLYSMTNIE